MLISDPHTKECDKRTGTRPVCSCGYDAQVMKDLNEHRFRLGYRLGPFNAIWGCTCELHPCIHDRIPE